MRDWLRRVWHEWTYDPLVELQRGKELLARRLEWSEEKKREQRKSRLKLWRADQGIENK